MSDYNPSIYSRIRDYHELDGVVYDLNNADDARRYRIEMQSKRREEDRREHARAYPSSYNSQRNFYESTRYDASSLSDFRHRARAASLEDEMHSVAGEIVRLRFAVDRDQRRYAQMVRGGEERQHDGYDEYGVPVMSRGPSEYEVSVLRRLIEQRRGEIERLVMRHEALRRQMG